VAEQERSPAQRRQHPAATPKTDRKEKPRKAEMPNYTAADVQEVRELTGAGMLDSKEQKHGAAAGDFDKAVRTAEDKGATELGKRPRGSRPRRLVVTRRRGRAQSDRLVAKNAAARRRRPVVTCARQRQRRPSRRAEGRQGGLTARSGPLECLQRSAETDRSCVRVAY